MGSSSVQADCNFPSSVPSSWPRSASYAPSTSTRSESAVSDAHSTVAVPRLERDLIEQLSRHLAQGFPYGPQPAIPTIDRCRGEQAQPPPDFRLGKTSGRNVDAVQAIAGSS